MCRIDLKLTSLAPYPGNGYRRGMSSKAHKHPAVPMNRQASAADKAAAFAEMPPAFREGIAARSKFRINPPAHIVVPDGPGYVTWCTSAPGLAETPLLNARRCPACVALLREYHEECGGTDE